MTDTTAPPSRSRTLRIALVAVAGLVAAAALYLGVLGPLLGGDDLALDQAQPAPVTTPVQDDADDASDAEPGDAEGSEADPVDDEASGEPLPETLEVFTARDPFQQLVSDEEAASEPGAESAESAEASEAGSTQDGGAATGDGTSAPVATPAASTAESTASEGTTAPPATRVGETVVKIVEITRADGSEKASVTINGHGYTVAEGQTFATSFRVLDISGDCATMLYGDSRFTLCAGEEIRK